MESSDSLRQPLKRENTLRRRRSSIINYSYNYFLHFNFVLLLLWIMNLFFLTISPIKVSGQILTRHWLTFTLSQIDC